MWPLTTDGCTWEVILYTKCRSTVPGIIQNLSYESPENFLEFCYSKCVGTHLLGSKFVFIFL